MYERVINVVTSAHEMRSEDYYVKLYFLKILNRKILWREFYSENENSAMLKYVNTNDLTSRVHDHYDITMNRDQDLILNEKKFWNY